MTPDANVSALLAKADSKLKTAGIDFDAEQYDDSVSRSYYAVFSAVTAALLNKKFAYSSHGQAIGAFNREFVKTGIFPAEFSAFIQALFEDRQTGDYDPMPEIDRTVAATHINNARTIIEAVRLSIESC